MNQFAKDVDRGLSAKKKHLSSKYFYDDKGSRIFQQIMSMPEYYLTNAEFEILSQQALSIYDALGFESRFNIIEFGAGDGLKTKQLLAHFVDAGLDFTYKPVDISAEANRLLAENLSSTIPNLNISPVVGDYFFDIEEIGSSHEPNLLLFLGSNIGNYEDQKVEELLANFNSLLKPGDKLLIGFDLQKNPNLISKAYNDPLGITKSFNFNLLTRINRELGGNFDLDLFDFYSHYNPLRGEVRSHLVSKTEQIIWIEALDKYYSFAQNELIWTELSRKYTPDSIDELAQANGFELVHLFMDCKHYFTDALWTKP